MSLGQDASHARWAGRQKKAEATIWEFAVGDIRFRCIRSSTGFATEMRDSKRGWVTVSGGAGSMGLGPAQALNKLLKIEFVVSAIAKRSGGK